MAIRGGVALFILKLAVFAALVFFGLEVTRAVRAPARVAAPRVAAPSPEDKGLAVAPGQLDFGEVYETAGFEWPLAIENRSPGDVEISEFALTCNCTSVSPKALTIPAGQAGSVKLAFDLTSERNKFPAGGLHEFEVWVSPRLRGEPEGTPLGSWKLRGRVRTTLRFERPAVDFGRHSEAARPVPPQSVVVASDVPLRELVAESDTARLTARAERLAGPGDRFRVVLSPSAMPRGEFRHTVKLIPVVGRDEELPGKALTVTGRIVPDFQASPAEVVFGGRPLGGIAEETLTLYSLTNESFEVVGQKVQGEGLTVESAAVGGVTPPTFRLKQRVSRLGQQEGRVIFRLRSRGGENAEMAVGVSYLGIRPPTPQTVGADRSLLRSSERHTSDKEQPN